MVLDRLRQSTLAGNVHYLATVPKSHQLKAVDSAIHRELHLAAMLIHHATHRTIHYTVDVPPPPPFGHDPRAAGLMSSGRSSRQPSQGARSHTSMPSPPAFDQDARAPVLHHLGSRRSSQGRREMILYPEYQHGSRQASRGGREVIPYQSSRHPSSVALQSQGRAGSSRHYGRGHGGYPLHPSRGSSRRHTHGFDGPGEEARRDVGQVQHKFQLQTQNHIQ